MTEPATGAGRVLHLAHVDEWAQALQTGQFEWSTRGQTLAQVGFIHMSTDSQLVGVAQRYYADDPEPLLLLVVDVEHTEAAGSPLRWESADGEKYPHVYGPIPTTAVVAALPVEFDETGNFQPPDLRGLNVVATSPE